VLLWQLKPCDISEPVMMDEKSLVEEQNLWPITVNSFGEKVFFNLNRHSFEKISAQAVFDAKFGNVIFNEDTLNIFVGTDSGLLPRYIQNNSLPKGARYIFIEPEAVLQALQANQMLVDLDERIVCVGLQDWVEAAQHFKITDYFYIDAVRSFNAICAQDDYINEYAELSWHITEVLSQLHWQNSVELGMEAFITRQINNIADNKFPAKVLEKSFQGKTAVLLAGGPSLDLVLPWVKQHRDKVVVLAVSRISRQLLLADIEPDFVFSVDPTELSFDISKEMLNFTRKTTFICSYHTVPTLLSQWLGLVFYLGGRVPWDSALNVVNLSSSGPTVTNTALSVAHEFGFKRVILAGVDLCFTREGFTHAKGSDEQLAGPRFNLTSLQVETNGGFMAPTSCDFEQAIRSLGLQAKMLTSAGCKIINIAAGAAKVENIDYMLLADIELEAGSVDVLATVLAKLAKSHDDVQYLRKASEELKKARFQIKAIARLAENARQINDEMYNADGMIVSYKEKKRLDLIEKKFKREHRHYSKLVKRFGIRSFIKLAKPFTDEDWTAEEARQLGNVYYEAYWDGATKLLRLIDDAIERVAARQQEKSDTPDFALLVGRCRKDRSFGRVRLWREKFYPSVIPPEVDAMFDEFELRFVEIINDKNTRHFARAKSNSNLGMVKQRAGLLFKHKKTEELRDLLAALEKHDEQEAAILYRHLINGYLAELQNSPDAALDAYQQIVDGGDLLLEEALIRIAGIGIDHDDIRSANLSLQCLSQLNPVYLPMYAEMRRLHGDILMAVDAYSRYIAQFPDDTLVQMKLAMLYVECKIYDAAEMMLDYILLQKPNLEAAVGLKRQLSAIRETDH
jgi:hypothetical protein